MTSLCHLVVSSNKTRHLRWESRQIQVQAYSLFIADNLVADRYINWNPFIQFTILIELYKCISMFIQNEARDQKARNKVSEQALPSSRGTTTVIDFKETVQEQKAPQINPFELVTSWWGCLLAKTTWHPDIVSRLAVFISAHLIKTKYRPATLHSIRIRTVKPKKIFVSILQNFDWFEIFKKSY